MNPQRKFSLPYAAAEVLWYLSGEDRIDLLEAYAPQYSRFAEDGVAFGAYGKRWTSDPSFKLEQVHLPKAELTDYAWKDQIASVIRVLNAKPDSRQAIVTMWNAGDLIHAFLGDHKDLPCTLSLNFLRRGDVLHLAATMRSNEVWLGLPYDIFAFTTIQMLVASELRIQPGLYIHQAMSEHLYQRNLEKAKEVVKEPYAVVDYDNPYAVRTKTPLTIAEAVRIAWDSLYELKVLHGKHTGNDPRVKMEYADAQKTMVNAGTRLRTRPIIFDLFMSCASKWTEFPRSYMIVNRQIEDIVYGK